MALVSGGTMICWCRCSTRGEREGKAVLVGWAADRHLVGVLLFVCFCVLQKVSTYSQLAIYYMYVN